MLSVSTADRQSGARWRRAPAPAHAALHTLRASLNANKHRDLCTNPFLQPRAHRRPAFRQSAAGLLGEWSRPACARRPPSLTRCEPLAARKRRAPTCGLCRCCCPCRRSLLPPIPPRPLLPLQAELTFDGTTYIATVRCAGGDLLEVVVEQKDDASVWSATFAAKCEPCFASLLPACCCPACRHQ